MSFELHKSVLFQTAQSLDANRDGKIQVGALGQKGEVQTKDNVLKPGSEIPLSEFATALQSKVELSLQDSIYLTQRRTTPYVTKQPN